VNHLSVDVTSPTDTVKISLHATFFHLSCDDINLDLEATRGDAIGDGEDTVAKVPVGEGCSLKGDLVVAKVGGNFHISTGTLGMGNAPMIQLMGGMLLSSGVGAFKGANISHTIHHLSFGEDFPGMSTPLKEVTNIVPTDVGQYQFHLKVIPTVYKPLGRSTKISNQYSLNEQFVRLDLLSALQSSSAPGVYFYYDFYPVQVEYLETKPSFLQFITRVCGIIGGIFTVAGVIDGILHRANEQMKKKE